MIVTPLNTTKQITQHSVIYWNFYWYWIRQRTERKWYTSEQLVDADRSLRRFRSRHYLHLLLSESHLLNSTVLRNFMNYNILCLKSQDKAINSQVKKKTTFNICVKHTRFSERDFSYRSQLGRHARSSFSDYSSKVLNTCKKQDFTTK